MKVTSPDGSETLAHLPKQDFAEGLEKALKVFSTFKKLYLITRFYVIT